MMENSAGWRYVQSADSVADYPTVSEHNAVKFQDLKSVVAGKAPASHTHSTSQVTGLDTALDGKAPASHTHSTSQVTGLDEALAGKAPLSTLNTRVPENLSLRVDTTVGTRIFAGGTMIYGDTGWRNVKNATYSGTLAIRRVGEMVMVRLSALSPPEDVVLPTVANLPAGFQSAGRAMGAVTKFNSLGVQGRLWIEGSKVRVVAGTGANISEPFTTSHQYTGVEIFPTSDSWPTSLPGLPA